MSAEEVDEYLRGVDEPKRSTLQALRRTILEIVPDAEQVISYRVPAFRVSGKTVAGFAAFKDHLSYLPFSGSVLGRLADELKGYTMTKSSLHFPVDRPLPKSSRAEPDHGASRRTQPSLRVTTGSACRAEQGCGVADEMPVRIRRHGLWRMCRSSTTTATMSESPP